jgi:peptidoglycan endopeptidase LytE
VAGGPSAPIGEVLASRDVVDAIWRAEILAGQTTHGLEKAGELRDLSGRADSAVAQIALRSDQNRRKVEAATIDRFFATIANKSAEQRVAAERAPAALFVESGASTPGSLADGWARLRNCESSGNYRAISPGGLYRGAYQFDLRTWEAVGGAGDPIDATPAEQDLRAQLLYDRRGRQPWPVCGRFLP